MLDNINQYIDKPETIGIKLFPTWHGTKPNDIRYEPVLTEAEKRGVPVLIYMWGKDEVLVAADIIAEKFPGLSLLIAHSGGVDIKAINEAVCLASEKPNVYFDLTLSVTFDVLIEYILSKVQVEKILYGSDMSYIDPRTLIGHIVFAKIGDSEKEKILGLNFLKLVSKIIDD